METKMPKTDLVVQLTGEDGNVFNFCGIVTKIFLKNGYREYATELSERLLGQTS